MRAGVRKLLVVLGTAAALVVAGQATASAAAGAGQQDAQSVSVPSAKADGGHILCSLTLTGRRTNPTLVVTTVSVVCPVPVDLIQFAWQGLDTTTNKIIGRGSKTCVENKLVCGGGWGISTPHPLLLSACGTARKVGYVSTVGCTNIRV